MRRPLPGGLLLRGVAARGGLSVALLLSAALTSAAAAIGPTYAAGAAESTLRDRLITAPAQTAGLRVTRTDYGSPDVVLKDGEGLASITPSSLFAHGRPVPSVEWETGSMAVGRCRPSSGRPGAWRSAGTSSRGC